jgi:PDZ domain-containing secreted protein
VFSIVLLVGMLALAPLGATSPYFVITPGGTYDVGSRVRVPEAQRHAAGHLAFTAVYQQEASWGEVARVRMLGHADVVPAHLVRPPGTTQQQMNETNRRLIDESKPIAAAVALRAAGYEVEVTGHGSSVESVIAGMPRRRPRTRWSRTSVAAPWATRSRSPSCATASARKCESARATRRASQAGRLSG